MLTKSASILVACGLIACSDTPVEPQAVCLIEKDGAWDEPADGTVDTRTIRHFDEENNLIRTDHDADADGEIDSYMLVVTDLPHRMVTKSYAAWNDRHQSTTTYDYDEAGNLVREVADENMDGNVDRNILGVYGPHGLIQLDTEEYGTMTRRTWEYNERGAVLGSRTHVDGELRMTVKRTVHNDGLNHRSDFEQFGERPSIWSETYHYEENGYLQRVDIDNDGDGTIDGRGTCKFTADGRFLFEELDYDLDGITDSSQYRDYDSDGRLIRSVLDLDGETGDELQVTLYSYDCQSAATTSAQAAVSRPEDSARWPVPPVGANGQRRNLRLRRSVAQGRGGHVARDVVQ